MANQKFDRTIINQRERPLSSDINQAQSQADRTLRDFVSSLFAGRASDSSSLTLIQSGVIGDSFKVLPASVPGMSVRITPGTGFLDLPPADTDFAVGAVGGLDDLSSYKPLVLLSETTIAGIVAPVTNPRIDIIEVRMNRTLSNSLSRDTLDTITGLFVSGLLDKTLSYGLDGSQSNVLTPAASTGAIGYKRGAEAVTPVAPAVSSGYMKIAEVRLTPATTSITRSEVVDVRRLLAPYNLMQITGSFTMPNIAGPPVLLALNSPPGIEVVVVKRVPPDLIGGINVYAIGGLVDVTSRATFSSVWSGAATGVNHYVTNNKIVMGPVGGGELVSAQVTELADATKAGPASTFAVGQPYVLGIAFAARLHPTADQVFENPVVMQFDMMLRR